MTKNYEIIMQHIQDLSVEIPDAETFIFSRENITKYSLGINITSNQIKNTHLIIIINHTIFMLFSNSAC